MTGGHSGSNGSQERPTPARTRIFQLGEVTYPALLASLHMSESIFRLAATGSRIIVFWASWRCTWPAGLKDLSILKEHLMPPAGKSDGIPIEISWNSVVSRFQEFSMNEAPEGFRKEIKDPPRLKR